jgi:hypothetical protein
MSAEGLRDAIGRLRRVVSPDRACDLSDAERDKAAFETLVWRYGPMVIGPAI